MSVTGNARNEHRYAVTLDGGLIRIEDLIPGQNDSDCLGVVVNSFVYDVEDDGADDNAFDCAAILVFKLIAGASTKLAVAENTSNAIHNRFSQQAG